MKKIALLIVCVVMSFFLNAQEEHFKFRNIPINGSADGIGKELIKLGYDSISYPHFFSGKFIGEDCVIGIDEAEHIKDNVTSIAVLFKTEYDKWSLLKKEYNRILEMYTEKYGEPTKKSMSFDSPYYDGDGYEISAIKKDKCNYHAMWRCENGDIVLKLSNDCSMAILYSDNKNTELDNLAKQRSMQDEI